MCRCQSIDHSLMGGVSGRVRSSVCGRVCCDRDDEQVSTVRSLQHIRPRATSTRPLEVASATDRLTLTTEELAARWGIHPESVKRAVRNGSSPVLPIIPGAGRWVFSIRAVERAQENTFNR